jgi:inositol-hexakisphosphate 5-kinase
VLASFLHDGEKLLAYHIPLILQKLSALAMIIYRLKGFRFYGCSLLFIYDGDKTVQDGYHQVIAETAAVHTSKYPSLQRKNRARSEEREGSRKFVRRTQSEDILVGSATDRAYKESKRKRGEVNIRIVDFAHTTTGTDYVPYTSSSDDDEGWSAAKTVTSGKGYQAEVDPETGLLYARFPPQHPELPDLGFLFGLKNLYASLVKIWEEEYAQRARLAKEASGGGAANSSAIVDGQEPLSPLRCLPTEPAEIFERMFEEFDEGMISS